MTPDKHYTSFDVCAIVDISYRQLDYWIRIGVIDATKPGAGSGSRRGFSRADISDIALIEAVRQWVWSPLRAAELISKLDHNALRYENSITIATEGAASIVVDLDELDRIIDERISAAFPEERVTA